MSFIENGSNASDYVSFISNMLYSCGQANVKVIEWPLYRVLGGGNSLITLDNSEAQVLFQTAAHHSCLLRNHVTSLVDVSHASNIKDFLNFAEEFQSIKDAVNFFPVHNSISHPMYKRKMRGNQLKFPSLVSPQTYNYQKVFLTQAYGFHGMMTWRMSKREKAAFYYRPSNQMTGTSGKRAPKVRSLQHGKSWSRYSRALCQQRWAT